MEDIRSVLSQFNSKEEDDKLRSRNFPLPTLSEIPDVFFDTILKNFKLSRQEISLLMFIYRQVWCKPNLYKAHGIGPLNSYSDLCNYLGISNEELGNSLRNLENFGLIETIRSGQYFVRKFFTADLDSKYGQNYDEFF